ncbi:cytosol aminopeptidase [Marinibactrum halimedae]|uniref:Cytosol aminopeptidase n=2 Tax=Marinibactrum halimedae TaxID=1444977 RepID=A0AA37T5N2_9GAMM|nr:cytosol aminopeptidase [Marinibactrum halimedae]
MCINFGDQGTPLLILKEEEYEGWLNSQTPATAKWLKAMNYQGEGLALLPDAEGEMALALWVSRDDGDWFHCGNLPTSLPAGDYHLQLSPFEGGDNNTWLESIVFSWAVGSYEFTEFKTKKRKNNSSTLYVNSSYQAVVERSQKLADAVYLVRDLINTPPDSMMPQHLQSVVDHLAQEFGATSTHVIGEALLEQNFPAIHAVGRASVHAPRLLDLTWGNPDHPKVTLVGKGVCFDSGGLDLKPANAMRNMKKDMGGAAHTIGLARLIMSFNLPVRLRLLVPAVENAVSGDAFRPGDVLQTRKGLTVEVDNTDAEGRLVLCDALFEACNDNPDVLIDFATLTGACRVALGTELPGMFTNSDDLSEGIQAGGLEVGDPVWRLPLHQPYRDHLKSDVADMVNCAASPFGGAITAGLFLEEFISEDTPWVHFDVMAWNNRKLPGRPIGGEAMGIRAVFSYLEDWILG